MKNPPDKTIFLPKGFSVINHSLNFEGIDIGELVKTYGTPFKFTYLPKIGKNIEKAKEYFQSAMKKYKYGADYFYCYCTKSSHFEFIISEALKHDIHLETSSAFDIEIINHLYSKGNISMETYCSMC